MKSLEAPIAPSNDSSTEWRDEAQSYIRWTWSLLDRKLVKSWLAQRPALDNCLSIIFPEHEDYILDNLIFSFSQDVESMDVDGKLCILP